MSQPLLRADFVRPGLWRGRGRETESEVGPTSCFHLGLFSETSSLHHLEGTLLVCGSGLRVYWVPGFVRAVFPHTLLISTTQLQKRISSPLLPDTSWWLRRSSVCQQSERPGFDPRVRKIPWKTKWQPTPVLLPRKFHGWRSLVGHSPWGHKESDTTKRLFTSLFTFTLLDKTLWLV